MGSLCRRLAFFVLVLCASPRLVAQDSPPEPAAAPVPATAPPPPSPPAPVPSASPPALAPPPAPPVAPASAPVHALPRTPGHTPASGATPPSQAPQNAPEQSVVSEDRRREDAHVDRVLLLPTAETQPEGTLSLSSYDIAFLQLGYAVTDTTQLTFSTVPFGEAVPLDFALKSTLSRGPLHRVAAIGAVTGVAGVEDMSVFIGRVGLVGQACLDRTCRSSLNLGATTLLAGAVLVATGTGVVIGLGRRVSIVAELDLLVPTSRPIASAHGVGGGVGLRWSARRWALDAGGFTSLDSAGPLLPLVAFSYRFLPDP